MNGTLVENFVIRDEEFNRLSDIVYRHCGINLHVGKKTLVRARLAKWLQKGNYDSFHDYLEAVLKDPSGREFSQLIDSLSTNVTSFFRENKHFEFLTDFFLPRLIAAKQKAGNCRIRAWSAGCSSGQEPYSIAMTLLEILRESQRWDVKILATDISQKMLQTARQGVYHTHQLAEVPDAWLRKYFSICRSANQPTCTVSEALKQIILFRYLNLMQSWPLKGPVDFIFCRNVMIYFDKQTQENLIGRFWELLEPGGILFTGHSESLTGIRHRFRYIQPTIYQKP